MNTQKRTNIYMATTKTGQTVYMVGRYSDGKYYRSLNASEYRRTGCTTVCGSLTYVGCPYTSENAARRAARRIDGYSQMERAKFVLGEDFS